MRITASPIAQPGPREVPMISHRVSLDPLRSSVTRRDFLKLGGAVGAGVVLGHPALWAQESERRTPPARIKTNIDEALAVERTPLSLPGLFPGRVVEVSEPHALTEDGFDAAAVRGMVETGIQ
ncbi:MAG: twin-arginine translocation signal domain-containing protein, partial [Candidatus Eisenbacteria bacterium]|nr:twin-arginine translocation signal domain-containing protein [Candidatus Eisenbacteria bacterium]